MPSFNHEAFVAEAMKSVLNQSYDAIELLVVDDCSTDATFEVVQKLAGQARFARRFRRMEISRNERNLGADQTLNRGLVLSRGEIVTFINSDDVYSTERLGTLIDRCQNRDRPFLAFSAVRLIDQKGAPIRRRAMPEAIEMVGRLLEFADMLPTLSFGFLRHQLTVSTGNIFINRALVARTGGFKALAYCHDWDFMLRAIVHAEPCYIPETKYGYRIHPANTFRSLQNTAHEESAQTLRSYFRCIATGRPTNCEAPTPQNWPHVFEMIARQFEVYDIWRQEASYHPSYSLWRQR
jgi:glycosyltransferase involved in cell wall biosynthesis